MNTASTKDVTELLLQWNSGDRAALDRLMPAIYSELRRLARQKMRYEDPAHTLQPTALVSEMYLRLVDQKRVNWQNRAHFFAVSAQIMRRILLNYARDRAASKRGSGAQKLALDDVAVISDECAAELLALGEALDSLEKLDPRKSRIVELRYFGGLTANEIAEVLKLHPDTITREWGRAKAFLRRELQRA